MKRAPRKGEGRPMKYTGAAFLEATGEYFKKETGIPNKAGLLFHLDISRETWRDYKTKEQFSDTIRKAEARIENAWVQRLSGTAATGPIFYLKNAFKEEYRDTHDVTSDGKAIKGNSIKLVKFNGTESGAESE